MNKYYILSHNNNYMVVPNTPGIHRLYGHKSWNIHSGPFDTIEEAEAAIPPSDEYYTYDENVAD